jgi:AcrR family transcriptional regulator
VTSTEPTTADAPAGLRERKRTAARTALQLTAVELALEHGYENTTVEMICDAGMVSHRTFFNYFGSKEGAFLGDPPSLEGDDAERFVTEHGPSIVGDLIDAMTRALMEHEMNPALFKGRRELMQRTPELSKAFMLQITASEGEFVRLIVRRLKASGRTDADAALDDEARMVLALTSGVMHFVMQKWFAENFTRTPHELLRESIALVQRITSTESDNTK